MPNVTNITFLIRKNLHLQFLTKTIYMKKNMGSVDKAIRIAFAVIVTILFTTGKISGTLGIVLLVLGGVFLATSLISFCPLYTIFGIKTCKTKNS